MPRAAVPDAASTAAGTRWRNTVDAFEWQPGAVGYHMASSEATTLRTAASEVWCKRMLEDGVAATLGPTTNPIISAFPPPDEFFALLLSGKYTLAESYYRSLPFTSWTMVLVGDPLYKPFQAAPAETRWTRPADETDHRRTRGELHVPGAADGS